MNKFTVRRVVLRMALLVSVAFMSVAGPAWAQAPSAGTADDTLQEVVVTGTRLNVSGYQQPTPVTVVGIEQIERDAHMDLSSVLQNLPAAGPTGSTNNGFGTQSTSTGTAGLAIANLRNLGQGRTLTLYDGVRVAPSGDGAGVDLNLLPSALVGRIDVVTGGASAAWGSDAVSGVVNIILNKSFRGFSANVEGAINGAQTRRSEKVDVAYGTNIGTRGRIILSASFLNSPDLVIPTDTPWYHSQMLVNNPAYTATNSEPRLIHVVNAGMVTATRGGLIVGPTNSPVLGWQFGPNGIPTRFSFGTVSGLVTTGGTFENPVYNGEAHALTIPIRNVQGFGHISYDLTDNITAKFEVNYARSVMSNSAPSYARNVTIQRDNAFLDPNIVALMGTATSFTLGTTNTNNVNIAAGASPNAFGLGNWNNEVTRRLDRQVASLEGKFGGWTWNVDLQRSQSYRYTKSRGNPIVANYNLAVDAVRVTSANVGTSGLAIGSIVCRSSLTTPGTGCVPLNILGTDVADPNAIAWVQGSGAYSELWQTQQTASAALRGEPFSTWAGRAAFAAGLEYRREASLQKADALSYARAYSIGNFQFFDANMNSKEGFAEINVPLIKDKFVRSLDVNAAGRLTDYSTSGRVETWKVGLTSQLTDDIRIRATRSRDIRAPTLLMLFNPGSSQQQTVPDPARGGVITNITTLIKGNPGLEPEDGDTFTAGFVVTPRFIPGFSASIDYYKINIKGAFAQPTYQNIIDNCQLGLPQFCALIQRDSAGVLKSVTVGSVNSANQKNAGWDLQADYRKNAFGGTLDFSVLGNITTQQTLDSLGVVTRDLNSLRGGGLSGPLKFRATYGVNYRADRFGAGLEVRHMGAAKLNQYWTSKDVDNNDIPAVFYVDLRGSYYIDSAKKIQAYLAIDNVLDKDPPIIPGTSSDAFSFFFAPTRTEIYDFLGRQFRLGVRAKF